MQSCFFPCIMCIVGTIIKFGCSLASKKFGFTSKDLVFWVFSCFYRGFNYCQASFSNFNSLFIVYPFIRTSNDSTRNSCWVISLNLPAGVHPANIPCFFRKSIPKIQGLIRFLQTTKSFLYSFCPILNSHSAIPIGWRLLPLADLT